MLTKTKVLLLGICLFYSVDLSAQISSSSVQRLARSVVQVRSGSKTGSGFLWKRRNWVVTTLHLIVNPNNIQVTTSSSPRTAKILKVLPAYDLVLLELNAPVSNALPVLNTSDGVGEFNDEVYSIGYNGDGNLNNIISRPLRVGYSGNNKLSGLLPPAIRVALAGCRRPDPEIQIIYMSGTLLPGFSGAPIVNHRGNLVGIADGGLDKGASSISWAINASFLPELEISTVQMPASFNCGSGNTVTFAADVDFDTPDLQSIAVGTSLFVKTKTRSVYEMMKTVDDSTGLKKLLNDFAINTNFDYQQFRYDIYEEITSGALFCLPSGTEIVLDNDFIRADLLNGDFTFLAKLYGDIPDNPNYFHKYNPTAIEFQKTVIKYDGSGLVYNPDPLLSYRSPIFFVDGLVNRYSAYGMKADTSQTGVISQLPVSHVFNTLIGRKDKFLGAAVINHAVSNEILQQVNGCLFANNCKNANPPAGCVNSCNRMEMFSKLIIGAHMAGISSINAL